MKKNLKHFPVYISVLLSQHSDFLILAFLFYSLEFAKRISHFNNKKIKPMRVTSPVLQLIIDLLSLLLLLLLLLLFEKLTSSVSFPSV